MDFVPGEALSARSWTIAQADSVTLAARRNGLIPFAAGSSCVSREQKLALILGFLAVLVVAILISDHYSQARKDQLAANVAENPPGIDVPVNSPYSSGSYAYNPSPSDPNLALLASQQSGVSNSSGSLGNQLVNQLGSQLGNQLGTQLGNQLGMQDQNQGVMLPPTNPTFVPGGSTSGVLTNALNAPENAGLVPGPVMLTQGGINNTTGSSSVTQSDNDLINSLRARGERFANGINDLPMAASTTRVPLLVSETPVLGTLVASSPAPAPISPIVGTEVRWHTVAQDESLYSITKKYYGNGNYYKQLAEFNKSRLPKGDALQVGLRLQVPNAVALGIMDPKARMNMIVNTNRANDSKANNNKTNNNKVNSKANDTKALVREPAEKKAADKKPAPAPAKPTLTGATASGSSYVVKKGDSLGQIAMRELGTMKRANEILTLNKLKDANAIYVGQTLKMPAK